MCKMSQRIRNSICSNYYDDVKNTPSSRFSILFCVVPGSVYILQTYFGGGGRLSAEVAWSVFFSPLLFFRCMGYYIFLRLESTGPRDQS